MRNFSVRQLAFDFDPSKASDTDSANVQISSPSPTILSSSPVKLPDFARYDPLYAVTSRIAGRINAASISESEHKSLLQERQTLLNKKFNGTITRKESNRLEYIRWSLDRVEDARHGQALQVLESSVAQYEQFLADLRSLPAQIRDLLPRKHP